jgi:hypothetical protein
VEVRNLQVRDKAGANDPFVRITVANKPPQVTQTILNANAAVFNQSFT